MFYLNPPKYNSTGWENTHTRKHARSTSTHPNTTQQGGRTHTRANTHVFTSTHPNTSQQGGRTRTRAQTRPFYLNPPKYNSTGWENTHAQTRPFLPQPTQIQFNRVGEHTHAQTRPKIHLMPSQPQSVSISLDQPQSTLKTLPPQSPIPQNSTLRHFFQIFFTTKWNRTLLP
jgi:hypothetical protein